jgi:hypothetical protein
MDPDADRNPADLRALQLELDAAHAVNRRLLDSRD